MSRRLIAAIVLAAACAGIAAGGPPAGLRPTSGRRPDAAQIAFALALKMDDRALERSFAATRRALTPAEVGRRFGVPLAAIARIRRELAAGGITVVRTYPQRTEIDARASVATLSRYFHVRFRDHLDANGLRFHAPTASPSFRRPSRPWVRGGVVGLDTRLLFSPADVRAGALVPADAALAYDLAPLRRLGIDGSGLTIAIASFQRFGDSDVNAFSRAFSLDGPGPQHVAIGIAAPATTATTRPISTSR